MSKRTMRMCGTALTGSLCLLAAPGVLSAQDAVFVNTSGDVGIGTSSPVAALDIVRSTGAVATVARLANNKGIQLLYDRTDAGSNDWQMSNWSATFEISIPGSSPAQLSINANGNLTIGGTQYLTGSSRDLKEGFEPVNGTEVLRRLVNMPLSEWSAKSDQTQRHIGPIAEDWWATFGLGPGDKQVSMTDVGGVALAAIQGLHELVSEKDEQIAELQRQLDELRQQMDRLAAGE